MKLKFYATALLALTFAGCNHDEIGNPLAGGPVPLGVTAGISSVDTRVTTDGKAFAAGDVINIVADGTSVYPYELNTDGDWSAVDGKPYYFQSREDVSFRAWYADPSVTVDPAEQHLITIDTKAQDGSVENWKRLDLLATPPVKVNVGGTSKATVSFMGDNAFRHIMSQLTIEFVIGDGITTGLELMTDYTLKGIRTEAGFHTLTCELEPEETTADLPISFEGLEGDNKPSGQNYTAAPLILVPQTFTNHETTLEITYNNQTYKATLRTPDDDGWQPGCSYTYTVTLRNSGLEIGDATIDGWRTHPGFKGNIDAGLE